jgi:hypothetical protein
MGFFDEYPAFYDTSKTAVHPSRLNKRYIALIRRNKHLLQGARVLDLASHDGRWAFAALKAGAAHVTGIEGRSHLIENARRTFVDYGVSTDRFTFIQGDVFEVLAKRPPDHDTVFIFGFLYHTHRHVELLSRICRNEPRTIIIDSACNPDTVPSIRLRAERVDRDGDAIPDLATKGGFTIVGRPSVPAIRLMVRRWGYGLRLIDWESIIRAHPGSVRDYAAVRDYIDRARVTMVAERMP